MHREFLNQENQSLMFLGTNSVSDYTQLGLANEFKPIPNYPCESLKILTSFQQQEEIL